MPPNRILIVLSSLCAEGTPVLALDLLRSWKQMGLTVEVATLFPKPDELLAEYSSAEINPICLDISSTKLLKFPDLIWKSYKLCRSLRPSVLISFPFGWHTFLGWGAHLAGVRHVVAHAGNHPASLNGQALRKMALIVKLGTVLPTDVIACSNYVAEGVRQRFRIPRKRIHTIYNAVDFSAFALERPKPSNGIRIGMVARLERHKDQPTLIRAAKLLLDQGIPARVELVGDGSRRKEYQSMIYKLGLQDHVELLGTRRDIPQLLNTWDLFVFSAKPDEGLGIALIEALAAGVPVIATDVGACREVLGRGDPLLGDLVQAGSAEAIADAVVRFIKNRSAWTQRAQSARSVARQHFSIDAMSAQYLQVMGING